MEHDGVRHEPGAEVALDDRAAQALLAVGAIEAHPGGRRVPLDPDTDPDPIQNPSEGEVAAEQIRSDEPATPAAGAKAAPATRRTKK